MSGRWSYVGFNMLYGNICIQIEDTSFVCCPPLSFNSRRFCNRFKRIGTQWELHCALQLLLLPLRGLLHFEIGHRNFFHVRKMIILRIQCQTLSKKIRMIISAIRLGTCPSCVILLWVFTREIWVIHLNSAILLENRNLVRAPPYSAALAVAIARITPFGNW